MDDPIVTLLPALSPSPTPSLPPLPDFQTPFSPSPSPSPSKAHASIWRVDYNAMVAKDVAMGWQGLGYVLLLNAVMFSIAFLIFQRRARSSRFTLFHFRTNASSPYPEPFTLRKWATLLWRTPLRGTDVEKQLGPEGTFYLVYQVYALKLLLALSVYAFVVLLPLYLSIGADLLPLYPFGNGTFAWHFDVLTEAPTPLPSANESTPLPTPTNATASGNGTTVENHWWSFAHATIRSIPNDSVYLWIPVGTCYIFTAAFLLFFHRLSALASIPSVHAEATAKMLANGDVPVDTSSSKELTDSQSQSQSQSESQSQSQSQSVDESETPPSTMESETQPSTTETESETRPPITEDQPLLSVTATPEPKKKTRKSYTRHLTGMQPSELSIRSLFVDRGLPKNLREARLLILLQEVFPGYLDDVCVVYNLAEFHAYEGKRIHKQSKFEREKLLADATKDPEQAAQSLSWSLQLLPGSMKFPYVHRVLRAWFCCACRRPQHVNEDAVTKEIEKLQQEENDALDRVLRQVNGAGRAFLIFKSSRLRARFVRRVRNASVASILAQFPDSELPRLKRYVRELGLTRWHLSAAPEPDDIDWHSVSFPMVRRIGMTIIVNVVILSLLFLFTSPVAVTSAISSSTSVSNQAASALSDFVASVSDYLETFSPQMAKMMVSYIPTMILVMINAVLLNVLQIAGRIQPIPTDSAKERMILRMSSVYLIFNTLFVPSLAFVSIDAVLLYLRNDGQVLDMLGTLFLHNSGIFYVNYVLQRCFISTAINLLRMSEFVKFSWEKPRAVTSEEHVKSVEAWPFFTGTMTAIQISMLTIVMTFSTVVPIILPIGALYFAMQHAVDKYSLLHVRPRIKGRGSIARTATHATIFSLLMYQGAMSGFFLVRGTKMQSSSVLVLLMGTYIVSLWWYIRDKERASGQTAKGHHVHGPHCKQRHRKAAEQDRSKNSRGRRRQRGQQPQQQPQPSEASASQPTESTPTELAALPPPVPVVCRRMDESTALLRSSSSLSSLPKSPKAAAGPASDEPVELSVVVDVEAKPSAPEDPEKKPVTKEEESDLYRAPALRKHGQNGATVRAAVALARRSSTNTWSLPLTDYGAIGATPTSQSGARRGSRMLSPANIV